MSKRERVPSPFVSKEVATNIFLGLTQEYPRDFIADQIPLLEAANPRYLDAMIVRGLNTQQQLYPTTASWALRGGLLVSICLEQALQNPSENQLKTNDHSDSIFAQKVEINADRSYQKVVQTLSRENPHLNDQLGRVIALAEESGKGDWITIPFLGGAFDAFRHYQQTKTNSYSIQPYEIIIRPEPLPEKTDVPIVSPTVARIGLAKYIADWQGFQDEVREDMRKNNPGMAFASENVSKKFDDGAEGEAFLETYRYIVFCIAEQCKRDNRPMAKVAAETAITAEVDNSDPLLSLKTHSEDLDRENPYLSRGVTAMMKFGMEFSPILAGAAFGVNYAYRDLRNQFISNSLGRMFETD